MSSVTVSVRMSDNEAKRLEKLAQELGTARPALLRQALRRGAEDLMFEHACEAYRAGTVTLSRAAEIADRSVPEMIRALKDADLELNYGVEELKKDLQS